MPFVEFFLKYRTKSLHICINRTNTMNRTIYYIKWSNFFKWTVAHYNVHIKISFAVSKIVYFSEILTHQK